MYPKERTYLVWHEYTIKWRDLSGNEQTLQIRNPYRRENDFTMRIFGPMDPDPLEKPITFSSCQTLFDGVSWSDYDTREEGCVRALCAEQEISFDRLISVTMAPVAKWITGIKRTGTET